MPILKNLIKYSVKIYKENFSSNKYKKDLKICTLKLIKINFLKI